MAAGLQPVCASAPPNAVSSSVDALDQMLIGRSPAMVELKRLIQRVAKSYADVLIIGESGTGKELVAAAIHKLSDRASGPYIAKSSDAISESLAESTLFGHEKGAFTNADERHAGLFESADGGSLFLDEIAEMSLDNQGRVRRALDRSGFYRMKGLKPVHPDFRFIAATNRDLAQLVARGAFRADLYYRLDSILLRTPPLRDRRDDIPLLIRHFLQTSRTARQRQINDVSADALDYLIQMDWPGNIRGLCKAVDRLATLTDSTTITRDDVRQWVEMPIVASNAVKSFVPQTIKDLEIAHILETLRFTNGNQTRAATLLGISRSTLIRRLEIHNSQIYTDGASECSARNTVPDDFETV